MEVRKIGSSNSTINLSSHHLAGGATAAAIPQLETIDPYDLLESVNVLAKMPKDFYERIVSVVP